MHEAPALAFQVGRSRAHGFLLILLAGLGLLAGVSWLYPLDAVGWRQALFGITFLILLVIAVRQWLHWPSGELMWDGHVWRWRGMSQWAMDRVQGALQHHLDWQTGLLLSLRSESGKRIWLWAERGDDSQQWEVLRRAVFAPRRLTEPTSDSDAGQALLP